MTSGEERRDPRLGQELPQAEPLTLPDAADTGPERTKTRLLELLKRHGPQTAQDLAARLQITIPAARRHLSDLQVQTLVAARIEKPGGRGRPQYVFALTERADEEVFPKTYAALCLDVLGYAAEMYGDDLPEQVFERRSARLRDLLQVRLSAGLSLRDKVQQLVGPLTEMGFDARLEEEGGELYLVQGNCPTLQVARRFKSLCGAELEMYEKLLGVPVRREEHIACGQSTCRYRIGRPEAEREG